MRRTCRSERIRALHGDCNRTDFVHVNPRAEVPALVDGEFSLYDSTVICEYLGERYPDPPLCPRDPKLRAECRLIEDLADTQLDAALYTVTVVEFGRHEVNQAMHDAAGRDISRIYDELEQRLAYRPYLCGDYCSRTSPWPRISWWPCSSASILARHIRSSPVGSTAYNSARQSPATTPT